jgi:O-antigen ligase
MDLKDGSGSGRFVILIGALKSLSENSLYLLLGHGPNSFQYSFDFTNQNAHNSYLRIIWEIGYIGFVAMFLFIFSIVKKKSYNNKIYPVLIAIFVTWIFNDYYIVKETWLFFALIFNDSLEFGSV